MFIIALLKLTTYILRTFTSYSATALPGLILEKYFSNTLKKLCDQLDNVVMITGTNGKTTTAKMLNHLLTSQNIKIISNPSGSNMIRGISSTLLDHCDWHGHLNVNTAIFEVEEGTMPQLVKLVKPKIIVVTNIFRDQLDAYGEIDKIFSYLQEAINLGQPQLLVLNADDARVSALKSSRIKKTILIGLDKKYSDVIKWENRGLHTSLPNYLINNIKTNTDLTTTFDLEGKINLKKIKINSSGIHNTFNAASSLVVAHQITGKWLHEGLQDLPSAFGRGEIISTQTTQFQLFLVKNPAGMNLNVQLLGVVPNLQAVLFILNDKTADGRDVSWIWDCDFSSLKLKKIDIFIAGTRKFDMALRLKYDGIEISSIYEDLDWAISDLLGKYAKIFVLPTYTAMLEFRHKLGKLTNVDKMWQQ